MCDVHVFYISVSVADVLSCPSHMQPSLPCRYGFEQKPYLLLSAKPKLFNRQVTFSYVTDWIEKRLIELVEVRVSATTVGGIDSTVFKG